MRMEMPKLILKNGANVINLCHAISARLDSSQAE